MIDPQTTVRYEGSIYDLTGLYGWVVARTTVNPAAVLLAQMEGVDPSPLYRYTVTLSRRPSQGGPITLTQVREQSLIVGPNPD